jgi:hypothetical protein
MNILIGVFLVLHGLVHLLYSGQAARFFVLQPGMAWPNGSLAVSGLFGIEPARILAIVACALAAIGFVVATIHSTSLVASGGDNCSGVFRAYFYTFLGRTGAGTG